MIIEINLLPEEMRKQKKYPFKLDLEMGKVKILIGGIAVGALILLFIVLSLGSFVRKRQIVRLTVEEQRTAAQKSQVEAVDKEISILKTKMNALGDITRRRFLWSKKLNELSDLVLPGIWLTRIYTDSEERLMIEGSVISKKGKAMASVGKFMKNIRERGSFFQDFSNIKLETVYQRSAEVRDVVDFEISLYFKDL
ncbi:PilN domain-containing protein [Candidatus Omnitrophota bacterium]